MYCAIYLRCAFIRAPYTCVWFRLSKERCLSESLENKVACMSRTVLRLVERHKELQTEVRNCLYLNRKSSGQYDDITLEYMHAYVLPKNNGCFTIGGLMLETTDGMSIMAIANGNNFPQLYPF